MELKQQYERDVQRLFVATLVVCLPLLIVSTKAAVTVPLSWTPEWVEQLFDLYKAPLSVIGAWLAMRTIRMGMYRVEINQLQLNQSLKQHALSNSQFALTQKRVELAQQQFSQSSVDRKVNNYHAHKDRFQDLLEEIEQRYGISLGTGLYDKLFERCDETHRGVRLLDSGEALLTELPEPLSQCAERCGLALEQNQLDYSQGVELGLAEMALALRDMGRQLKVLKRDSAYVHSFAMANSATGRQRRPKALLWDASLHESVAKLFQARRLVALFAELTPVSSPMGLRELRHLEPRLRELGLLDTNELNHEAKQELARRKAARQWVQSRFAGYRYRGLQR
ncbi:hypothetical protein [Ferrimonas marina]|nr:hypothetical protein [Ferrimonas marina]